MVGTSAVTLYKLGGSNAHIRNCTFRAVSGGKYIISVSVSPNANAITTDTTQIADCLYQENSNSGVMDPFSLLAHLRCGATITAV